MTDGEILEMIQTEAKRISEAVYADKGTQYGVADVPTHIHNDIDSTTIPSQSVEGFTPIPAITGGVFSPGALGSQVVAFGDTARRYSSVGAVSQPAIPIYPVPIIYGGGSSTSYTLTGSPVAGATSATLTAPYGGVTGTYATAFASTEIKNVRFTNGSTGITWTNGLQLSTGGTGISLNGASVFQGGNAPLGTVILFSSELALNPQIWVRINQPGISAKWWGTDLGTGIWGFTA